METGGWMRVFCTSANTLRRRRLPIPSLARPIQRSVSLYRLLIIWWSDPFCMCLKKPPDVPGPLNQGWSDCDEAPQRTPGCHHASKRVGWSGKKICNLPLFSCSKTLFLFFVLQEPLLTNFLWMSDDVLVVNWMNRIQNHSIHLRSSLQCSCSIPHLIDVFQHYLG